MRWALQLLIVLVGVGGEVAGVVIVIIVVVLIGRLRGAIAVTVGIDQHWRERKIIIDTALRFLVYIVVRHGYVAGRRRHGDDLAIVGNGPSLLGLLLLLLMHTMMMLLL